MQAPGGPDLGRKTHEIFAAHWPHTDEPGSEQLNSATKHVASTTRNELEWQNSRLIEGEVDEFRLQIFPLVLGRGKRLFDGGTVPAGLEPAGSKILSSGVIFATYRSGAEIKYGSFAAETPSEAELARRDAHGR